MLVSQQIIDEVLIGGGNELDSTLRIAAYFKKDHTTADNAGFLQKEYRRFGDSGKGFLFGGNHVSVWFDESGIRIAAGDTVRIADAALVTWEQAAKRIRELLDMGRFMPQSELDKVYGHEIKRLADELWYTHQDRADNYEFSFLGEELFKGGFPDSTARIAELLAQPEQRRIILGELREFAADFEQNPSLLRFRFSTNHLRAALEGLSDLEHEPLVFTADETVSSARPSFITQDELDRVLAGGGQVENGKYRIYSYFLQEHTAKEKADFLKHEYGTGGGSRTGFDEWHDSKGIAYSRENNHMPYDKVILSWPKVAKRIDELIADGRYMSEAQLAHLPEYEKDYLAGEVFSFYPRQPEDLPRPFPYSAQYSVGKKIIRPQLDDPERVAEILQSMAAILDNTADFDRNYEYMRKAFDDLTSYQNGTFSLFTPAKKSTEQAQARPAAQKRPAAPTPAPSAHPADEAVQYDLQLGATVYLGIEEFEIYSFDDARVMLRDANAPLFTREMSRDEFDRKLRENRLNDGLIKTAAPTIIEETPRILYKKYLPILLDEIRNSELYDFLRDEDTDPLAAETEIGKELDSLAESIGEDAPAFYAAYSDLPQFRDWLIEDILDRTYQDVASKGDSVEQHEDEADCPDWAKQPPSDTEPEPYTPKKGDRYEIQGRLFVVDKVDTDWETVSLRDITFQSNTGFPIFRSESLDFIRMYSPIRPEPETTVPDQHKNEISGLKSIVIDLSPRDREVEPVISYPGEIVLQEVNIPRYTVKTVSYVDVISSNPPRVDIADKPHAYGIWDGQNERYLKNDDETYVAFDTYGEAEAHAAQLNAADAELTPAWEKPKPRSRTQTFDAFPGVPMSERHNFIITDDTLGHGGAKTKYRGNVETIRTLQAIEAENYQTGSVRFATPEEQEILSRYVGWGSLADAFDESNRYAMGFYLAGPQGLYAYGFGGKHEAANPVKERTERHGG